MISKSLSLAAHLNAGIGFVHPSQFSLSLVGNGFIQYQVKNQQIVQNIQEVKKCLMLIYNLYIYCIYIYIRYICIYIDDTVFIIIHPYRSVTLAATCLADLDVCFWSCEARLPVHRDMMLAGKVH